MNMIVRMQRTCPALVKDPCAKIRLKNQMQNSIPSNGTPNVHLMYKCWSEQAIMVHKFYTLGFGKSVLETSGIHVTGTISSGQMSPMPYQQISRWIFCYKYDSLIGGLPITGILGISRTVNHTLLVTSPFLNFIIAWHVACPCISEALHGHSLWYYWECIPVVQLTTCTLGCPSGTKFWRSTFCFLPKLTLGLNN